MIELFATLPQEIKQIISRFIDQTFDEYELEDCAEIIAHFANALTHQEEKDFTDFYFKLKLEQIKNENSNDLS